MLDSSTSPSPHIFSGAVAGIVAGLVASWAMTQFQTVVPPERFKELLGEGDGNEAPQAAASKADETEDDTPATVELAETISEALLDREIPDENKQLAGQAVHYIFGTSAGMTYGMMAEPYPEVTIGSGTVFGAAFWLAADEVAVPAFGLSEPPLEHPPSTHLYSLASHLVYGFVLETTRRLVRSIL
jgi:uncharacterized membrane protein YagU involved in acid resistance